LSRAGEIQQPTLNGLDIEKRREGHVRPREEKDETFSHKKETRTKEGGGKLKIHFLE